MYMEQKWLSKNGDFDTMSGATPCLSVIIACYNDAAWVGRAIKSAIDQGEDVEVIIVDDGSTDESLEIIKRFKGRIRCFSGPNKGVSAARNCGLFSAQGKMIYFLDSDDYLIGRTVIETARDADHNQNDLVIGMITSELSDITRKYNKMWDRTYSLDELIDRWLSNYIGLFTSRVLWNRTFLTRIGGWNEVVRQQEDAELFVRASLYAESHSLKDGFFSFYQTGHSEGRLGSRKEKQIIYSKLEGIRTNMEWLLTHPRKRSMGKFAYFVARDAFRHGYPELGEDALKLARQLGVSGHLGSLAHRVGAQVLGLPLKERIAVALRPVSTVQP